MACALSIFVVETEIQYLAFVSIHNSLNRTKNCIVFTTEEKIFSRLKCDGVCCQLVSWGARGWLGRLLKIRRNLKVYENKISSFNGNFSEIKFHIPRLDNIQHNIAINYLKYHFSNIPVSVHLIPDGALNIFSRQLTLSKLKKQDRWARNIGFRLFPDMEYIRYQGDELGANAEIVESIYCFEGVETNYPLYKVKNITLPLKVDSTSGISKKALVIGQNFLELGTASKDFTNLVSAKVYSLIENLGIKKVDYAPHPRSSHDEFYHESYSLLDAEYLCVEEHIARAGYEYVISCYSSVLINSKIMFGDKIHAVSVGLYEFPFPDDDQGMKLAGSYEKLGIEVIR